MDSNGSITSTIATPCRPQTVSSSNQGEEDCSDVCMEDLQSRSTKECHHLPLKSLQEQFSNVHEAVGHKNMNLLSCLIKFSKLNLEEKDRQGLTPLYNAVHSNFPEGALLLLKHGADVHNAESIPENLCLSHQPLMHLAMKSGSEQLVAELIKRGASITVRDVDGKTCVLDHGFSSPDALFQCLASSLTEEGSRRSDQLHDLLFVIGNAAPLRVNRHQVEEFIRRQPGCHKSKMFEVFAACLCLEEFCKKKFEDKALALHFWRLSAECTPCQLHDHTREEEKTHSIILAAIFDLKDYPLPDSVDTDDDNLTMQIHAVFAIEKYLPKDGMFIDACAELTGLLLELGKTVTSLSIIQCVTAMQLLNSHKVWTLAYLLLKATANPDGTKELPFPAVMDSLKAIWNCLSSLNASCSKAQLGGATLNEDELSHILHILIKILFRSMQYWYSQKTAATVKQLQDFTSLVKDIIRHSPNTYCRIAFCQMDHYHPLHSSPASMIKDVVAFSSEVRGTVRQENSPLHLESDEDGDTLLHCLARFRSKEDLVQEGVLQCFLDHGADLCTTNNKGETVRSILVDRRVCTEGELLPSLQCLAATAFMRDERLSQSVQNCGPSKVRNFLLDH